jgi:hypothetical protein
MFGKQAFYHEPLPQPCFVIVFFNIGSLEVFAQAGFKP